MKLGILAVGHKLPDWVAAGCHEYAKRMPRELPLAIHEIKPEPRAGKNREQLLAAERTRIDVALAGYARIVVLDERGADLTTLKLAERLEAWMREGGDTAFVIGGADGIDPSLRSRADLAISFGRMVWPHMLARVMLSEQLYRAATILSGSPYHRE